MKIVLYSVANQGRAGHVAEAMQAGLRRHGITADILTRWNGQVAGDMAIAYGWKHEPTFSAYRRAGGHFAYFDMGYFNRKPSGDKGGSREGHHRLAINEWDTIGTMKRGQPSDRWDELGIEIQPDRAPTSDMILVAGMSDKAAGTHGFKPGQWERDTVSHLTARFPTRQVILRAKPRNLDSVEPIAQVLERTGFIVTHHSNVAVDGLVAGVPCWSRKGVGKLVSRGENAVEGALMAYQPSFEERRALLADVAYCQWAPDEMRSGAAWAHIKELIK